MAGERTLPGLGLDAFWTPGSDGWNTGMDDDLRLLSAQSNMAVKSRTVALPGVPTLGDIYIAPTGDANADSLAVWDGPAGSEVWNYYPPNEGWQFFVLDELINYQFVAGAWIQLATAGGGGGGGGGLGQLFHVRQQEASGVEGGASVAFTYTRRILNTVVQNDIPGASLVSNEIILPPGSYFIQARQPAKNTNQFQSMIWNVTAGAPAINGTSEFIRATPDATDGVAQSFVAGNLSLAVQTILDLRYYAHVVSPTNGLGRAVSTGQPEVYSEVYIWKQPETGVFNLQYQLPSGSPGGASNGAQRNLRLLNTIVTNTIAGASLTVSIVTLPIGAYSISATAPGRGAGGHRLIWRNTSDGVDTLVGPNTHAVVASGSETTAFLAGDFVIAAQKTFILEHWIETGRATSGLGTAVNEPGIGEIYATVEITKTA